MLSIVGWSGAAAAIAPRPRSPTPAGAAKLALRDQLLTARSRRPLAEVGERRGRRSPSTCWPRRRYAGRPPWRRTSRSAREPGTGPLLDALRDAGQAGDAAGACCPTSTSTGRSTPAPSSLAPARRGLLEPVGPRLGVDAVATADVVLVPGLAVVADRPAARPGRRLLRPGAGPGAGRHVHLRAALRRRGRLDVPVEPHDRPVTAAATPGRASLASRRPGSSVSVSSAGVLDGVAARTPTAASRRRPRGRSGRCSGR